MRKTKNLLYVFLLIILASSSLVSGWGISSPYWEGNPLVLKGGDSRVVSLTLQNMVEGKDIILKAELSNGAEIAELADESSEYIVPFGRNNIPLNIRVTIPEDAEAGKEYDVSVSLKQIASEEGRMLQLSGIVVTSFPVLVTGEETEVTPELPLASSSESQQVSTGPWIIFAVVGVIVVTTIIYVVLKRKKS